MHARLAEIGLAGGVGGDFVANALELSAANVFEILTFGRGGGGFIEIDRNLEAAGDFGSDVAGHGDAILEGDAVNGNEGYDVGGTHARVRALVMCEVDQFRSLAGAADGGLLNGFPLANEGDDAAIVVGIHLSVKQIDAGNLHSFDNGVDFGRIAAFREIGNAFNKSVGHERRIMRSGAGEQTGLLWRTCVARARVVFCVSAFGELHAGAAAVFPGGERMTTTMAPTIRAPRGNQLRCKGWQQEAALRCLMNNLDPEVAERPADLVVYGGIGKAARNWECFHAIVRELEKLGSEETLLVQSGKPVAVFPTHEMAPRVIIANSNLVGKWANWEHFNELDRKGLMMYGQMTAGSWIYIGTQGILQGTFQTFAALAERHFGGTLKGKLVVTGGVGGMGGAQPLSVTLNDGVVLAIDVDRSRIERRVETRYCDTLTESLDEALALCEAALCEGRALSVGLVGNCGDVLPEIVRRGVQVDVVTDQTSAHDPLNGYVPQGLTLAEAAELRQRNPEEYVRRATATMVVHVDAMLALQRAGAVTFDYGNNIRRFAFDAGCADAFLIPGFVPEYIRPLFCTGTGPFRWVALSGDPKDIDRTDELALELFPDNEILTRWLRLARGRFAFQGLPSRICWLNFGERARMGLAMNELVRKGEISAPIAIGRDHLDTGSVASPYRETEKMLDGSDAVADWPILNALLNTASGATWVSFHHGGGVGMGYSLHAGQVTVADGTEMAARKIVRVLNNDPGLGVVRHADAGYELAQRTAREKGIQMPMAEK